MGYVPSKFSVAEVITDVTFWTVHTNRNSFFKNYLTQKVEVPKRNQVDLEPEDNMSPPHSDSVQCGSGTSLIKACIKEVLITCVETVCENNIGIHYLHSYLCSFMSVNWLVYEQLRSRDHHSKMCLSAQK